MKTLNKDISNKSHVKQGESVERRNSERDLNDLRVVMSTKEGRRYMWRLLGRCKTFESVWNPSGSMLSYNTGRQDLGHELMIEIIENLSDHYLLMQQEAFKELKNNE